MSSWYGDVVSGLATTTEEVSGIADCFNVSLQRMFRVIQPLIFTWQQVQNLDLKFAISGSSAASRLCCLFRTTLLVPIQGSEMLLQPMELFIIAVVVAATVNLNFVIDEVL